MWSNAIQLNTEKIRKWGPGGIWVHIHIHLSWIWVSLVYIMENKMLQYFLWFHFKSNICGGRLVIYIDQITCHIGHIYIIKAKRKPWLGVQGYLPIFSLSVHQVVRLLPELSFYQNLHCFWAIYIYIYSRSGFWRDTPQIIRTLFFK